MKFSENTKNIHKIDVMHLLSKMFKSFQLNEFFLLKVKINEPSYCQKYVSEGGETSLKEYIDWGCL